MENVALSDSELVEKLRKGNVQAFDCLYEKYKNPVLKMAYLISGNAQDSEDIAQETFVICFLHIKELKEAASFRPWLYQILTRTAWKYCKKKSKEIPKEDLMEKMENVASKESSLDLIIRKEQAKDIWKVIDGLHIKQRTAIILYYYQDFSTKEIAGIMHCMEGTVKSRLFTGRNHIKKLVEQSEEKEVCIE